MKAVLLAVSVCCLIPPFTPLGIGGLVAWFLLTITFRVADEGVEQMSTEIQTGNSGGGCLWLGLVTAFVLLGGLTALGAFATIAMEGRP